MPIVWDPWPGKTKENIVAINLEFFIMLEIKCSDAFLLPNNQILL